MKRLVLDMADARPIFAVPDGFAAQIERALPEGWEVAVVDAPAVGTGDGGDRASSATVAAVHDAEVYLGLGVPEAVLEAGPGLRWVHTGTAGVGGSLTRTMLERDVTFTNSAGIHGPPVAETVLAFILHFARGLDHAIEAARAGEWRKDAFDGPEAGVREIAGSTVGVIGLGGIGREVARRARALGARVVGTRRRPDPLEEAEVLSGPDALRDLLDASHYVVLALPETDATRGLIGAEELAAMRDDGVLINVARGGLVDEDALVAALRDGRIRGAALDVFATEPLPSGHPLWSAPRTLITPHVSAYTHAFWRREGELILDNIDRYLAGRPLRNVVDKRAGY